jgi:hypothetical protein
MSQLFEHTRKALEGYDRSQARRDKMLTDAKTNEDVAVWEVAERQALVKVQAAYHKDTKRWNSRANCALLDIGFMQKMARKYAPTS